MTKSYISMEQKVCVVCGITYDTNSILMYSRLKDSMEEYTVTGYGACPEHQELADKGYIALVGADEPNKDTINTLDANRTGELVHIRQELFTKMFVTKLDPNRFPMIFVGSAVISQLKQMAALVPEESESVH